MRFSCVSDHSLKHITNNQSKISSATHQRLDSPWSFPFKRAVQLQTWHLQKFDKPLKCSRNLAKKGKAEQAKVAAKKAPPLKATKSTDSIGWSFCTQKWSDAFDYLAHRQPVRWRLSLRNTRRLPRPSKAPSALSLSWFCIFAGDRVLETKLTELITSFFKASKGKKKK